jgi:hypothetical protein
VLKHVLFPDTQPSRKRRRIDNSDKQATDVEADADVDVDSHLEAFEKEERSWEIVLESSTGRFLISPPYIDSDENGAEKSTSPATRMYKVSRIVEAGPLPADPVTDGEDKPSMVVKPAEPAVDAKLAPPTWSTPPAEPDPPPSFLQNSGKSSIKTEPPASLTRTDFNQPRAKLSAEVLSSGRGQEHFYFAADGISIEGLDPSLGLGKLNVRRWRRASPKEFATS